MEQLTMSLPGLNISAPEEVVIAPVVHDIKACTEWRFEVAFDTRITVKVSST